MFPLGDFSLAHHDWDALRRDSNVKAQMHLIHSLSIAQG
jgi:hypothetical protein